MKPIREGKVKKVYDLGDELLFEFTDNISVFDKIIPSQIPHKGRTLCLTSAYWFRKMHGLGIKNHFIECKNKQMRVKKFNIINNPTPGDENYLVPLEFIVRYYLAGSLYDRLKRGEITSQELGFKSMPEYGEKLPEPLFEITTKFEAHDRKVDFNEAMKIGGITRDEIDEIREIILKLDSFIAEEVEGRGLIHVDGKKEFALGPEREIYVVDTFGTMDEDRWWDKMEYENGNIVQLSKEFVRQYYRDTGYFDELMAARRAGAAEPPIPPLPDEMVFRVSELYVRMYEKITGERYQ